MKHAAKPQQPTPTGGKTVALNGSAIAEEELLLEEAALQHEAEQLEEKRKALFEQKEAAKRAEFDRKMSQYTELMSEAKAYRTEASKTDDEDTKLLLLKQAAELTSQANLVAANLGIEQSEEIPGETLEVSYDPWRWWIPFMQLGGLMAIILWCYHRFFDLKNEIVLLNKTQEAQINPYNLDSIQKLFFEKLAVGIDLFALLGILAVLAPSILLYLLPFLRSRQDFATDFKNELTPWQRILISSALLCSFLLYLALSHLGQTVKAPAPAGAVSKEEQLRKAWLDSSAAEAWVREKTNRNDHPRIVVYNKAAGSFANGPYCAAGLYFTATRVGMQLPIRNPASVASWFADSKKIIYDRRQPGRFKSLPQTMDVVWLYRSHIEGLAQPVRRDVDEDDYITTVAFNSQGNNPKQGVYFPMRRRWRDVRKVANYVTPYVRSLEKQPVPPSRPSWELIPNVPNTSSGALRRNGVSARSGSKKKPKRSLPARK